MNLVCKKKILYVHHAGGIGGAPRSLAFLIEKLDKNLYDPVVLSIESGPVLDLFREAGAKVILAENIRPYHATTVSGMSFKRFIRNNLFILPSIIRAAYYLNKIKPDLIHLNTTCLFAFAIAAKLLTLKSTPVITHVREPLLESFSGNILRRMNYHFTDWDISICKYDQSKLINRANSSVVYNFVDFDVYNNSLKSRVLRHELNIETESNIITFLGRVSPPNGVKEFIGYALQILNERSDVNFVVVGMPDEMDNYCKNIIDIANGHTNIHLLGFRNDIPSILGDTDIHICPFTKPHFSRGVIEAAAMGVPSLGNNVGGVNELIKDKKTGLLYNGNYKSFRTMLYMMLNYEYKKELGDFAELDAKNNFDASKNSQLIFSIYNDLL